MNKLMNEYEVKLMNNKKGKRTIAKFLQLIKLMIKIEYKLFENIDKYYDSI